MLLLLVDVSVRHRGVTGYRTCLAHHPPTPPHPLHWQAPEGVTLPVLPRNAHYEFHPNGCYDWGTIGFVLVGSKKVDWRRYTYFIFLNSSVRGPFLPVHVQVRWAVVAGGKPGMAGGMWRWLVGGGHGIVGVAGGWTGCEQKCWWC